MRDKKEETHLQNEVQHSHMQDINSETQKTVDTLGTSVLNKVTAGLNPLILHLEDHRCR